MIGREVGGAAFIVGHAQSYSYLSKNMDNNQDDIYGAVTTARVHPVHLVNAD